MANYSWLSSNKVKEVMRLICNQREPNRLLLGEYVPFLLKEWEQLGVKDICTCKSIKTRLAASLPLYFDGAELSDVLMEALVDWVHSMFIRELMEATPEQIHSYCGSSSL